MPHASVHYYISIILNLEEDITDPDDLVYALHIPKNGIALSRWYSYLLILIYPSLIHVPDDIDVLNRGKPLDDKIHFNTKVFHRDDLSSPWTLTYAANFSRNYKCSSEFFRLICAIAHPAIKIFGKN